MDRYPIKYYNGCIAFFKVMENKKKGCQQNHEETCCIGDNNFYLDG